MDCRASAFLMAMVLSIGAVGAVDDDFLPSEELEVDHALTFAFPTPHIAWARPYAGGRARILFFTRGMGTSPRECVELMQRFDIDGKAAYFGAIIDSDQEHWHGGRSGEARIRALLDERWDAFVFAAGVTPGRLSNECQVKLLTQVVDRGAGLVLAGVDDPRLLLASRQVQASWTASGAALFAVGRGRAARLPERPLIPFAEGWQAREETWQESFGRAVLWAAGKEPATAIRIAGPAESAFGTDLAFTVSAEGQAADGRFEVSVRRPADGPLALAIQEAGDHVVARTGILPAGDYHLDVRLLGPKGVVSWGTRPFAITTARRPAQISLAADWAEDGGRLAGTVALAGPPLPHEAVRLRLLDPRRRELVRRDLAGDLAFDIPVAAWFPMLVTVEAQVLSDGRVAATTSRTFNVCRRGRDRFNFLMWDCPQGTLAPYVEQSLAQHGITLQLGGGNPPLSAAANGISWVIYSTRFTAAKDAALGMKLGPVDWYDEQALAQHAEKLAAVYEPARRHGVFAYSLGDENITRGSTSSSAAMAAYRTFLRGRHATIEALNAAWGTAFADWEAVGLSHPGDIEEDAAYDAGCYPRWFDRQAFKSWSYLRACGVFRRAFAARDPQAKTGFEGAGEFSSGDDLDAIVQSMDFWSPYPGLADEVAASIAPRCMPRANWMGYTKDADSLLGKYWRMVMFGMDAAWWWRWDAIGRFHGWLAPDLGPYPAVRDILEDTRVVREGVGDLLLRSERLHDGIAILYSYPSVFASRIGQKAETFPYDQAHAEALRGCRALGLEARYVTDAMLRRDPAALKPFRTLLLVGADALGDAEVSAIRAFADGGGLVVTDRRPGIYDGNCRQRGKGALDAEFGIAGAGPAGGGAGKAGGRYRLLDHSMSEPAGRGAEALRTALLAAGHSPRHTARDRDGKRPLGLWTQEWRHGDVRILAMMLSDPQADVSSIAPQEASTRPAAAEVPVTVTLAEGQRIFDLRSGRDLGQGTSFPVALRPDRATLIALIPGSPATPAWSGPASPVARGGLAGLKLSVPGARGLHPLRISATVDGAELPWVARSVLAADQAVEIALPIAYNDPPGIWRIRAQDVLTGASAILDLRIGDQP